MNESRQRMHDIGNNQRKGTMHISIDAEKAKAVGKLSHATVNRQDKL